MIYIIFYKIYNKNIYKINIYIYICICTFLICILKNNFCKLKKQYTGYSYIDKIFLEN